MAPDSTKESDVNQKYPLVLRGGHEGNSEPVSMKSHREDAAWVRLYEQVENPAVAEAVVKALVEAPDSFPDCQALYLTALATMHRHQARRERVQWLAGKLRVAVRLPGRAYQVMLQALPRKDEPAVERIEVLNADPATASSVKSAFAKAGSDRPMDEAAAQDFVEANPSTAKSGVRGPKAA